VSTAKNYEVPSARRDRLARRRYNRTRRLALREFAGKRRALGPSEPLALIEWREYAHRVWSQGVSRTWLTAFR